MMFSLIICCIWIDNLQLIARMSTECSGCRPYIAIAIADPVPQFHHSLPLQARRAGARSLRCVCSVMYVCRGELCSPMKPLTHKQRGDPQPPL